MASYPTFEWQRGGTDEGGNGGRGYGGRGAYRGYIFDLRHF